MFLRISKLRYYRYMQVVYSQRVNGSSKQRIVALLGRYDEAVYLNVKKHLQDWIRLNRAPEIITGLEKGEL